VARGLKFFASRRRRSPRYSLALRKISDLLQEFKLLCAELHLAPFP
jgi:hypothetical protein